MRLHSITKPTLLVELNRVRDNIKRMAEKASKNSVDFRPHFKTHQSAEVAEIFRQHGVNKITVTTVEMAEYFASHNWTDITIAMPANIREINKINELAANTKLGLIVDSELTLKLLKNEIANSINIWIEVKVGYNRSGISYENYAKISKIVANSKNSQNLNLIGFLSHFGNTYQAKNKNEVQKLYAASISRLFDIQTKLKMDFNERFKLSIGDTPSCSILDDFGAIDEIRPGNFVFYDLMQLNIGSCTENDIAVALTCPVISKDFDREEIVLYGGAVHLSKEFINFEGENSFGAVVPMTSSGWGQIIPNAFVKSISQEHAVVKVTDESLKTLQIGDLLGVIPVHSCLTANLMGKFTTTDGNIIKMARFR